MDGRQAEGAVKKFGSMVCSYFVTETLIFNYFFQIISLDVVHYVQTVVFLTNRYTYY